MGFTAVTTSTVKKSQLNRSKNLLFLQRKRLNMFVYEGMYSKNSQKEVLSTLLGSDLAEIYLPGKAESSGNHEENTQ